MKFAVSKGETEIAELAGRLFEIKGRGAALASAQAQAALLKANPHLSDLTKVKPGTLIVIPETAEIPILRRPQTADAGSDAAAQLKFTLENLTDAVDRSAQSEEADLTAQLEALKDRELRDFAANSTEAKEQLGKLTDTLKSRAKELKTQAGAHKKGIKELFDALEKLPS